MEASDQETWIRHPSDLARLVFNLAIFGGIALVVAVYPEALEAASADLVNMVNELPQGLQVFLAGTAQLLTVVVPVVIVVYALWTRHFRELALVAASAGAAAVVMWVLESTFSWSSPDEVLPDYQFESWLTDASFPSVAYLAALTAAVAASQPLFQRSWRRAGWVAVGAAVLVRLMTGTQAPMSLLLTVVIGSAVASAVLLIVGAPARRPGTEQLVAAAAAAGVEVDQIVSLGRVGAEGRWFHAVGPEGGELAIKYVDGDERDTDLLYRMWRAIRVKGIEDTGTGLSPEAAVSHEAMMTMLAANRGVPVPAVVGVAETERGAILITTLQSGQPLDALDDLADGELDRIWADTALLHENRIAHRQLDAAHIRVGEDEPLLGRFRWAQPAASDELIAIDVADLLVATGSVVGPERAVAAAEEHVDHDTLAAALPYLQSLALAAGNKKAVRSDKELLGGLRDELADTARVDEVEMAELERVGVQSVIGVVGFAVLIFFLLGLIDAWDEIREVFQEANITEIPLMIVLILLTNVAGAVGLMGAVNRPLPLGDTTIVMFGQSFLNRFTPANAGGMAMRIRYLQKGGTDLTVGTAAVGLTSAASGVVQAVFLVIFVVLAGASTPEGIETESPDGSVILLVVIVVAISAFVVVVVPTLRRYVMRVVRGFTAKIKDEFAELLHRPGKLTMLFGAQAVSKLLTMATFVLACRSFEIDVGTFQLLSAYMVATTIASAVPTPGGVGAVEAALVLTLTGLGVDEAVAWSATLLFRLISYWMPIIPGAVGYKWSQMRDLV